jgi:hypothetical protein
MSKRAIILLQVHHPLFDFNQTIVGPFDFLQYLLCVWISFALCAVTRKFRSFDVLTNTRSHHLLQRPHTIDLSLCRPILIDLALG